MRKLLRSRMYIALAALFFAYVGPSAATATVKESSAVQFHVLTPGAGQDVQSAGYDFGIGTTDLAAADNVASVPAMGSQSWNEATGDPDDSFLHDPPRSRMKKWFLAILLVGGLIRYLTSPSYAKFVSDVLSPLNW